MKYIPETSSLLSTPPPLPKAQSTIEAKLGTCALSDELLSILRLLQAKYGLCNHVLKAVFSFEIQSLYLL